MSDGASIKIVQDGIGDLLRGMLSRAGLVRGWLNRIAYPTVIKAQQMRWMTEGASEGEGWAPLEPKYAKYKLRKFVDYPGGGRKMLIATNRLADGVMAVNLSDHYKLVTATSLETGTTVNYAKYVNEKRNFTTLSQETVDRLMASLQDYLAGR